jgi:parallel beta-helix repeat protein
VSSLENTKKLNQPNQLSGAGMYGVTHCAIAPLLLATGVWFGLYSEPSLAQTPTAPDSMANVLAQAPSTANQLYVNPDRGNDRQGEGTAQSPFRTITHALRVAGSDTTIVLAPGTYSAQTGETFPLELKRGVTISGLPEGRGRGVVIQGGGSYVSRTVAAQNVTMIGENKATLTGVTITNPNRRGYGLWIESTSPTITNNTFTGNTQDGIFVAGNGSPMIRENNFIQNSANGMTINGTAKPEVRDNSFERTGFGINVLQEAAPLLIGNRIRFNKDGVVVQGEARPVLRNNLIEGNERNGIVAITNALPDLGYSGEPGGNIFRNNREYDINGEASKEIISAFGNEMTGDRTIGRIDVAGVLTPGSSRTPVAQTPRPTRPRPNPSTSRDTSGADSFPRPTGSGNQGSGDQGFGDQTPTRPSEGTPIPVPQPGQPINIPVPAPRTSNLPPARSGSIPTNGNRGDSLPVLLPVPDPNAPIGSGGSFSPPIVASRGNEPPAPDARNRIQLLGLRYRVTVDAPTSREQSRVRSVVPEAFRTILNGRTVMQVGVFRDAKNANEVVDTLNRNGIRATIQEIE